MGGAARYLYRSAKLGMGSVVGTCGWEIDLPDLQTLSRVDVSTGVDTSVRGARVEGCP